ncbi:MAG: glycosyltransferase [Planctomycetota bacterium]
MQVALVHECIAGYHGSERVLAELAKLYPDAPIFVLIHHTKATRGTPLEGRDFRASFLDRLPWLRDHHRLLLPLMPYAVEQHDLRGFDVVISSHHTAAHGVLTRSDQLHLAYTHSPFRYAWDLYADHFPPGEWAPLRRYLLHRFRGWDQRAALRVDGFAANSRHVARRVHRTYRRDARVIYPPVDTERFRHDRMREEFYVVLGRLVAYKHAGVVVDAFTRMGKRLVVIGDGPERQALEEGAGRRIEFLGQAEEAMVADRLSRCRALVFAAEEDFGIAPVEAMAAGAPVIAWDRGGVRETVIDGETGVLFGERSAAGVVDAVRRFERGGVEKTAEGLHCHAEAFGLERFRGEVTAWVEAAWRRFSEDL